MAKASAYRFPLLSCEKGDMLFITRNLYEDFTIILIDFRYFGAYFASIFYCVPFSEFVLDSGG